MELVRLRSAYSTVPPTYHVQWNYYKYRTELALMIHKYIPYSAYQVKKVNCHQPIQAPLKYYDNYFHAGIASHFLYGTRYGRTHIRTASLNL